MKFGVREIVPIALLLVALAIAFDFLDPSKGSSDGERLPISLGDVPPTVTPSPTHAPTAKPPSEIPATLGWIVMFVSITPAGTERLDARYAFESLSFDYPAAPFNDMRDDAWKLVAEASVSLGGGGSHAFSFEHDGEARLFVDGREAAYQPDGPAPQVLRAVFDHAAGPATIRIEVRDTGGPVRLVAR